MNPINDIELRNNKSHITLNIYNPKQLNNDINKSESAFPIANSSVNYNNTIFLQYPDNIRSVDDRKLIKTDYPMIEGQKNVYAKSANFFPDHNDIRKVPIIQQTPNFGSYEKNIIMNNYLNKENINNKIKKEDEKKFKWKKYTIIIITIVLVFFLLVIIPIIVAAS